ncbi:MAG: RNA 3'-terminal phosphate cyclase [Gemmatimonadota bacterium]|nr:MAG: RNA 3'-terminal phosphate cyclase [Gemmatimonadota bacterium]
MIEIDGSYGEGGGAILRQALGFSAYSGEALRILKIRAGRRRPGLAAQHLRAVEAAGGVCGARVRGASLGSTEVTFDPGSVRPGSLRLDVGTAGATTLVLQTVLLPCFSHPGDFVFELGGGTDVPYSPPADYLANVTLPALSGFGSAELRVERRGYYPKGGGRVLLRVSGGGGASGGLEYEAPGEVLAIRGISHAASALKERHVAERQADAADHLLERLGCPVTIEVVYSGAASMGSGTTLWTESRGGPPLGGSALGARDRPSEEVGREAARALMREMDSGAAVDRHLADQLVPFLAVYGGTLSTSAITSHVRSNIYVAERMLGSRFEIDGLRISAPGLPGHAASRR